jgi:hypothetical protein
MENLTYTEFIENILNTRGRFNCGDEYHERHHIIPKCMNGTNEENNLIDLFAREHFIAHKLLAKENPDNDGLVYGWICMAFMKNDYQERYEITAEEYESLKKIQSELQRGRKRDPITEETRNKMSLAQKARFENPNERQKYKEMLSGENANFYGKHHSEETKRKQSESKKGKLNPNFGKHYSEAERKHLSELLSGENNPMYGKHLSEETRKKLSQAHTNPSEETRQKMRDAKIGIYDGASNPGAKAVICLETHDIYGAATVASEQTGIGANNICRCCRGERKSAGGYRWKFVYDATRKDGTVIFGALSLGLITEDEIPQKNTIQND